MQLNYSNACDEKIPLCQQLAKEGQVQSALEQLMALEKLTRTAADTFSTSRILIAIVQICSESHHWKLLNEYILLNTKQRSQLEKSFSDMITECCKIVDDITDQEDKLALIYTLRIVTAGKTHLAVERARLTHKLAMLKEAQGKIDEAANILGSLQMETCGSMGESEKIRLILDQMRLVHRTMIKGGCLPMW